MVSKQRTKPKQEVSHAKHVKHARNDQCGSQCCVELSSRTYI